MPGMQSLQRVVMLCAIPAIAISVAARQLYLSTTDDLSTWKGGGMGMFAGSENNTRYAKIYLRFSDGRRQPLLRLTPEQEGLKTVALNYPSERNLTALAQSIKATRWWASTTRIPFNVFDAEGQKVQEGKERLYDLYPASRRRSPEEASEWTVEIQYWKATYNSASGQYIGNLTRTFRLKE